MSQSSNIIPTPVKINPRTFIVPAKATRIAFSYESTRISVIVPTYAPKEVTLRLVEDLLKWNPGITLYVIDDCTPETREGSFALFRKMAALSPQVTLLRTPSNKLKAGALNFALEHMEKNGDMSDVILTVDDDVVIAPETVRNVVTELMSYPTLGAVCSQCRVFNKNKNILTRLQGLEYVGFNAIRLADEGFLRGPLVMHGMLTAFRTVALRQARRFAEGHLIEDYEMTTRLKSGGWSVKSAANAPAWTVVPETPRAFWRQRTRWSYGGMTVVAASRHPSSIFQDLIGHTLFLATLAMVLILLLSDSSGYVPSTVAQWIVALSLLQLGIWFAFQVWLMRFYKEKDIFDWVLRLSLIPELLYGTIMTIALIGSYVFLFFNVLKQKKSIRRFGIVGRVVGEAGARLLQLLGYREKHWGTRAS